MCTTTILDHMSLLASPTKNADNTINEVLSSKTSDTLSSTMITISRPFDIRRVQNSETEVRLSMDVPVGLTIKDLQVQMEQDKEQEDIYLLRIGAESGAKVFPLTAESIDVNSMRALLKSDNVLEVRAYKTTTTSTNPFQMVAEAFQAFTLNTWSSNPNTILRKIPVEEKPASTGEDESTSSS